MRKALPFQDSKSEGTLKWSKDWGKSDSWKSRTLSLKWGPIVSSLSRSVKSLLIKKTCFRFTRISIVFSLVNTNRLRNRRILMSKGPGELEDPIKSAQRRRRERRLSWSISWRILWQHRRYLIFLLRISRDGFVRDILGEREAERHSIQRWSRIFMTGLLGI